MSKSTFSQISDLFRNKKQAADAKSQQQYDEYLLTLRNDNTNADEAAFWIKCILYVLTAFVVYLGYHYYLSTFSQTMDPFVAMAFAVAIPVVVEIGKLKLVTKGFRAISLGWIDDGIPKTIYWAFVLIIGGGAFWWSYTISTGGIKEVAKQNAEVRTRQDSLHLIISGATSDIDRRITEINQSNRDAATMKTKRGKIAWSGQQIQMNNSTTLLALQQERQKIVDQVTQDYQTTASDNKTKVSAWASFIERFGGWGEIGSLFCLIALAVFERILRDQNRQDIKTGAIPPPYQNGQSHTNGHPHQPIHNAGQRYYFNRPSPTGNVESSRDRQPLWPDENAVPQSPHTVPQQNGPGSMSYADSVLELCRQGIQKDIANFNNRQANAATVAGRIHKVLDTTYFPLKEPDFTPTYETGIRLYTYLKETVFPRLNQIGFPYENELFFVERLYHSFAKQPV